MANYCVFREKFEQSSSKTANVLKEEKYGEGYYERIDFSVRSGEEREAGIQRIQDEMDLELLAFLKEKRAVGYQLVPASHSHVCIHVLYSWTDKIKDCDNLKVFD